MEVLRDTGVRRKRNDHIALEANVLLGSSAGGMFGRSALTTSPQVDKVRVDPSISI